MDLGRAAIVLRPRSLTETLDLALRALSALSPRALLGLSLVYLSPPLALLLVARYGFGLDWVWVWVVGALLASLVDAPFTYFVSRRLFHEEPTLGELSRTVAQSLSRQLGTSLYSLFMLSLTALTGFLMLPWAMMRLGFVKEATLLEGYSGRRAWARASALAKSPGAPAFSLAFSLIAARLSSVMLAEALGQGLVGDLLQLGQPVGSLWRDGGSAYALAGLFVSTPYVACARFLEYLDLRTRTDAWDVQVRFMALAAKGASS
jgi:hypothetical protein